MKFNLLFRCVFYFTNVVRSQKNWPLSAGSGFMNQQFYVYNRQYNDIGPTQHPNGRMFFASIRNHQLHKNLTLNAGIIFNYNSSNANSLEYNNYILDKQLGVLMGAEYTWFQRKMLSFSSSLELAYYRQYLSHNFQFGSIHTSQPTFHINFAKLRVGRDLGGFIQLGYGIKGIVGIGIDYRLF